MANEYPVPDEGLENLARLITSVTLVTDQPQEMRLYVNDLIPQRTTVLADYVEASFGGYSRRLLEDTDWDQPEVGLDHVARVQLADGAQEYTPTESDVTVYGVYLVNLFTGKVQFARRFSEPIVTAVGTSFRVMPVVTARSELYTV